MGKQAKKQFIDKKNAVKFKVVHRSQYDPLIADEQAPKYVLVPVGGDIDRADEFVNYGTEAAHRDASEAEDSRYTRLEKQAQYGVFYDDDYDYMQHLKEVGAPDAVVIEAVDKPKNVRFNLPEEVFPSAEQNEYAPLELAAAQGTGLTAELLSADFDVLAQLDDAAEHCEDWAIDDDFVAMAQTSKAGAYREPGEEEDNSDDYVTDEDDDEDGYGSDRGRISDLDDEFELEETRTRFTEYSMTSSVMHRNDKLQLLDEQFERMYADYDEENIGELDEEEAAQQGRDIRDFEDVLDAYIYERESLDYDENVKPDDNLRQCAAVRRVIAEAVEEDMTEEERTAWRLRMESRDEWIEDTYRARRAEEAEEQKWDCETILTTYTNIYNHPKLISEKKQPRAQPAAETEGQEQDQHQQALEEEAKDGASDSEGESDEEDEDALAGQPAGTKRDKHESKEEKRARKQAVKAQRKERREEKKTTKLAFKAERLRQEKLNNTKTVRL